MGRRGRAGFRTPRAVGGALALSLFVTMAACADEDTGEGAEGSAGGPGATTPVADSGAADEWGLEFIGGTAGEANGEPFKIGFAHSSDFFPEGDAGADAAVEWINTELGGVGGRPLELVTCNVASPADGARCGAELANDPDIDLVVGGLVLHGNADLYAALDGEAAAIIAAPLDTSDYTSPHAVAYNPGALGAGMGGAEYVATALEPETTALIVTDDVAGRGGAAVLQPVTDSYGIEVKQVFVPPTATAPEIASALQAAGAAEVDVISIGLFEQGCIAAYDALRSLGLEDRQVATTAVCTGSAMQEHLREVGDENTVPNGWIFIGSTVFNPDQTPDWTAYIAKFPEHGDESMMASTAAPLTFAAVVNAAKLINQVGVEQADQPSLDAAVRGFTGPAMLTPGPIECGVPPFISICASQVPVVQYSDGEWTLLDEGVDLTKYLRPEG